MARGAAATGNTPTPGDAPRRDFELPGYDLHAGEPEHVVGKPRKGVGNRMFSHVSTRQRVAGPGFGHPSPVTARRGLSIAVEERPRLLVEPVLRPLHARTVKDCSRGSQPVGSVLLCQDVSGRVRRCQVCQMPLPVARRTPLHGALTEGQVRRGEPAHRSLRAGGGDTRFEGWPSKGDRPLTCSIRTRGGLLAAAPLQGEGHSSRITTPPWRSKNSCRCTRRGCARRRASTTT